MKNWLTSVISLGLAISIGSTSARALIDDTVTGLLLLMLAVAGAIAFGSIWFSRLERAMSQPGRGRKAWVVLGLLCVILLGVSGYFVQNWPMLARTFMVALFTLALWMVLYFAAHSDALVERSYREGSPGG